MKRAIIFSLMLILLVSLSYAVPFTPQGNVDLKDYFNMTNLNYFDSFKMSGFIDLNSYGVANATYLNSTYIYQNGYLVVDYSNTSNLNVNSSKYWDDLNTPANIAISDLNQSGEADLNVNSSSYWDSLNSPADFVWSGGLSGSGLSPTVVNDSHNHSSSTITDLDWTKLQNYPSSCSANTYVTSIGDTLTCSAISDVYLLNSGDTGNGNYIFNGEVNATSFYQNGYLVVDYSNVSNLNVNSSEYWDNLDSESDLTPSNFLTAGDYLFYTGNTINANNSAILGSANDLDSSGNVADDSHYHGNATITDLDWTKLQNYPVSCPANTYLTQLGDAVTCTGISDIYLLNTGDTAVGDYIITGEVNATSFYQDGIKVIDDSTGLSALTSGEIDQLENIGITNISSTQWGYLGGQDQAVATTSNPTFATLNTGQGANELYAMDQNVRTTDSPTFNGLNLTDSITGLNYTINANSLQQNLIGFWGFEYGSNGTAYDSSREGNDGTLVNMDNSTCWVAGKDGTALEFDGTNDYITVPQSSSLNSFADTDELTISGWWMLDETPTSWTALIGYPDANANGFDIHYDGSKSLYYHLGINGIRTTIFGYNFPELVGNWSHITITTKSGISKLYINGVEKYSATRSTNLTVTPTSGGKLYINNGADYWKGKTDDIRIYNRALSEEEVRALYYGLGSQPTGHLALK